VVLWILAVVAFLVALTALYLVRRAARRLDTLNQSYWELRYDYTRLRAQVARGAPAAAASDEAADGAAEAAQRPTAAASMSFVPLSSIRKKES
jgi:hypothetical protein